jgi:hypothetical protein
MQEKEKEIEIFFLLSFWPEGPLLPSFAGPLGLINRQPNFADSRAANWAGPIGRSRPQPCSFPSLVDV